MPLPAPAAPSAGPAMLIRRHLPAWGKGTSDMSKPRQACVDCHFFVSQFRNRSDTPLTDVVNETNRESSRGNDFSWCPAQLSLMCHLMVWDQGVRFDLARRYEVIVETERSDSCFFFRWRQGMLLPAARLLQEREAALREASRDRRLTLVGLWIAAIALIVGVILQAVFR